MADDNALASKIAPARRLREIHGDVITIRRVMHRAGIPDSRCDQVWNLVNEAFRRGCEWTEQEGRKAP